jgi:two-component system CheB/CheR fusion protein
MASQTAKGLRVLLVEDHADCAASMALLLRTDGHDVSVAVDGPAALDEAQASIRLPPQPEFSL